MYVQAKSDIFLVLPFRREARSGCKSLSDNTKNSEEPPFKFLSGWFIATKPGMSNVNNGGV